MINLNQIVGTHDIIFVVFDTLRYDAAELLLRQGKLNNICGLAGKAWEKRHAPGTFTFPSHHAMFAGFLPTPVEPSASKTRLFASAFAGSETTGAETYLFDEANLPQALECAGYETHCIGGVGFFNKKTPLSTVFPDMFQYSYWNESLGVTEKRSTEYQLKLASHILQKARKPVFLYINLSALHQPNWFYCYENKQDDTFDSHCFALQYVDSQWEILIDALTKRGKPSFHIYTSDHGTLYGEDGFSGHRVGHPKVLEVPYLDFEINDAF